MNNLALRIFSAIIIVICFVTTIMKLPQLFTILMIFIASSMLYEWYDITHLYPPHTTIGLILIPQSIIALILINILIENRWILLAYFILIWSVDVFAMIGGKIFKGPKLAPVLSPNKTWSGLISGVICSIMILSAVNIMIDFEVSKYYKVNQSTFILCIGLIAFNAQLSDLLISYFKRYHKVKDSGNIIPGHGGMLDRFDSIILTAPILLYITMQR